MKPVLPTLLTLLLAGCATTPDLPSFEAASSENALVRWYRKRVSLLCDCVAARSTTGAVVVRLYKQSPSPLAEFRLQPDDYFLAKGRLAGRGWAGPAADAPAAFSSWIAFLKAYRASEGRNADGRQLQMGPVRAVVKGSGDEPRTLNVSNAKTGEVISAVFN